MGKGTNTGPCPPWATLLGSKWHPRLIRIWLERAFWQAQILLILTSHLLRWCPFIPPSYFNPHFQGLHFITTHSLTPSSKCVSICLHPLTKIVPCLQSQVTAFLPVFLSPPCPLPPLKASPLAFLFSVTLDLTLLLVHSSPSENSLPFVALELTSPTAAPQVLTQWFFKYLLESLIKCRFLRPLRVSDSVDPERNPRSSFLQAPK